METTTMYTYKKVAIQNKPYQSEWQRIILLIILCYEAAGCLLGGVLLIAAPYGELMGMPVDIMNGTFRDFLIPGIILFGLGLLNAAAFASLFRRAAASWLIVCIALGGLAIWFWVEIAILLKLHWLHLMWGGPVVIAGIMAISLIPTLHIKQNILLISGIFSSLLYAAINVIVAMQWEDYNPVSQTISELSAIGAPTRTLWLVLSAPYTLLMFSFAFGVWKSDPENRPLRTAGALLIAYAVLGIFWPFAPMHLRETLASGGSTLSDTMHIALGVITEIIYLIALGMAATALGKQFRFYSIATFLILLVFGVLTFLDAPDVAVNRPTPLIGVWERINIGVFLLWVIVLAGVLLQKENRRTING